MVRRAAVLALSTPETRLLDEWFGSRRRARLQEASGSIWRAIWMQRVRGLSLCQTLIGPGFDRTDCLFNLPSVVPMIARWLHSPISPFSAALTPVLQVR